MQTPNPDAAKCPVCGSVSPGLHAPGKPAAYRIEAVVLCTDKEPMDLAAAVAFALDGYHVGPILVQPVSILSEQDALPAFGVCSKHGAVDCDQCFAEAVDAL